MRKPNLPAALAAIAASLAPAPALASGYRADIVYPDRDGDMNVVRRRGPCIDPWVTIALEIVSPESKADPAKCAPILYKQGRWSNFNDLIHAVAATQRAFVLGNDDLKVLKVEGANVAMIGVFVDGQLVAAGGGNLVAAGGGNAVPTNAGNLVGNDGASLVAAGGGNAVAVKIEGNKLVAAGGGNLVAAGGGNLAPIATATTGYVTKSSTNISLPGVTIVPRAR